jgi:hypothetical protein
VRGGDSGEDRVVDQIHACLHARRRTHGGSACTSRAQVPLPAGWADDMSCRVGHDLCA